MASLVVAIAGGSGSGKTSLVKRLIEGLGPERCCVLEVDSYYRDLSHMTMVERCAVNFDAPTALELDLFTRDLARLVLGESIDVPQYVFASHQRAGYVRLNPAPIIFAEGIYALYDEACRNLCQLKIFIDVPHDMRLQRRLKRDVQERGRTEAEVLAQYESTVRPMYDLYVEPTIKWADVRFELADQVAETYTPLVSKINELYKRIDRG